MLPDDPDPENESALDFAVRNLAWGLVNSSYTKPKLSDEECTQIIDLLHRNEELPTVLCGKLILFLAQTVRKRRSGPNPATRAGRNGAIISTMKKILRAYGLHATRNPATTADSAASIVSKALHTLGLPLSEPRIEKIYRVGLSDPKKS